MTLLELLRQARATRDYDALADRIPYARSLGVEVRDDGDGPVSVLPFSEAIVGNPMLPAIHGGVTGAFLETAAIFTLLAGVETTTVPKTVNITIDFLRSGRPADVYARGTITRLGRRVASVRAEAWQERRDDPIAHASLHFLLG